MSNPLVGFLVRHALLGIAVGWGIALAFLWLDVGLLGTLIAEAEQPWLPLLLLFFGLGVTFGSVAMGSAIMLLGHEPPSRGFALRIAPARLRWPAVTVPVRRRLAR